MRTLGIVFFIIGVFSGVYGQEKSWEELDKECQNTWKNNTWYHSLELFEETVVQAKKEFGKMHENYAKACNDLGSLYRKLDEDYYEAEKFLKEGQKIRKKIFGKSHVKYAQSCYHLAFLYHDYYFKKSEKLYLKAKEIFENMTKTDAEQYVIVCNALAELYSDYGYFDKAKKKYLEIKNWQKKTTNTHQYQYCKTNLSLARLYYYLGSYKKAENIYLELKVIQEKLLGKNHLDVITTCYELALCYHNQNLYKLAEQYYLKVIKFNESKGKESIYDVMVYTNLADIYKDKGLDEKAEKLYLKGKKIKEKPKYSFLKIPNSYIEQHKKNAWKPYMGIHEEDYAIICKHLAFLYEEQGLYEKAEVLLDEVRHILERFHKFPLQHESSLQYAIACVNLAKVYSKQKQYNKAYHLYAEAHTLREKYLDEGDTRYFTNFICLDTYLAIEGIFGKGTQHLLKSRDVIRKKLGKKNISYLLVCYNLAVSYCQSGQYEKAEPLYKEVRRIANKTLETNLNAYNASTKNLAFLCEMQGRFQEAAILYQESFHQNQRKMKHYLSILGEVERQLYLKNEANFAYETYNSFAKTYIDSLTVTKSGLVLSQMYNNQLYIKSLLFNSSQKTKERIFSSGRTDLFKQYKKLISTRKFYQKLLEVPITKRKKRKINLEQLSMEINELEKGLVRQSNTFAKELEEYVPHTWQEVQQQLKPGEAAIELIRFRWYNKQWTDTVYYAALIVTPESKYPEPVFLTNGNFLEDKAYQFYRHSISQQTRNTQSYAQFWQPIQQRLQQVYPSVKKVFVSLDGVYHKINLATLWNPQAQKYVGEQLDIQLVSNTKDLLKRRETEKTQPGKGEVSLFGYPAYKQYNHFDSLVTNQKLKPLPATLTSVKTIANIVSPRFAVQAYTGKAATEEQIKAQQNPQVLHLATHGFFLKNQSQPKSKTQLQILETTQRFAPYMESPLRRAGLYWVGAEAKLNNKTIPDSLENGILTAQEALNLTLDSTQLVVLSACETGRGKIQNGEGVYGLQRAFLSAGAKYVLMSLWKVDDEATRWFMQYFYESWVQDQNVRKAYRMAQQRLRIKYPAPYYWGAFVLVSR